MSDKTETKKTVVKLADLDALEGDSKKQFDAVLKARENFIKAITAAKDVPPKHLRVLRREMNSEIRGGTLQSRKARLKERIEKMNARLASLD